MRDIETSGRPRRRSHSLTRIQRRTPSGRVVTHYKYPKTGKHECALCKGLLAGKPRGRPCEIGKFAKSERKPERPFGGMLCPACSRKIISLRAKLKFQEIKFEDVPISLRSYL